MTFPKDKILRCANIIKNTNRLTNLISLNKCILRNISKYGKNKHLIKSYIIIRYHANKTKGLQPFHLFYEYSDIFAIQMGNPSHNF